MKVDIEPGKYVLAVSGGVDSMVLLDLLSNLPDLELIVAHFNHGIRKQSKQDENFVKTLAKSYGYTFEVGYGQLGQNASEELARKSRYEFLAEVKDKYEATAIVTAHHQDDVIETALINLLRGTGPKGLISLNSSTTLIRPLLKFTKQQIVNYAHHKKLKWVEDESNQDEKYLRNKVRRILVEKLSQTDRAKILRYQASLQKNSQEAEQIVGEINKHIFDDGLTIKRQAFIFLPTAVANEIVLRWLRENNIQASRYLVERLATLIKTGRPYSLHNVDKQHNLELGLKTAHLKHLS